MGCLACLVCLERWERPAFLAYLAKRDPRERPVFLVALDCLGKTAYLVYLEHLVSLCFTQLFLFYELTAHN